MAQFKILLMTPSVRPKEEKDLFFTNFLYSTISEFYSDIKIENVIQEQKTSFSQQKVSYCYTYNEKISIHANSQKDFSFSMLRNIWQNDERIVNPFVPIIHAGTQILLIDQFDNHLVFTVKNISYELKEENIVYNYSCQDSFTYQTIRQNAGYFISNDAMSNDFIGAKTIDWWVSKKIKPECHIGYEYLYMQQGLWQDSLGNVHIFDFLNEIKETLNTLKKGTYCKKILKQPWNKKEHSDFFEPISFSADGSNASQVLIDLGGKLGLNLRTFERCLEDGSFKGYFWFEQSKNEENNGLIYSPYSNIQSFGFSHEASSLTTILNIQSHSIGEELVTIFPEIPPFFLNLFHSKNWENTAYTTGWFSSFCTSQIFIITKDSTDYKIDLTLSDIDEAWKIDDNTCEIKLPLFSREETINEQTKRFFKVPEHYPYYSFLSSDGKPSTIIVLDDLFSNLNSTWQLVKMEGDEEKLLPENLSNYKDQEIPDVYLKFIFDKSSLPNASKFFMSNPKIYLHFFRDYTEDEINFARAADRCPWLENKLIDFSYFLNHNIINLEEYQALLNVVKNDLRVVNGQIIYYNNAYQTALKEKTETLSKLLSQLETLNATVFAELVDKYAREGKITNTEYFDKVYAGVQKELNNFVGTSILDREDLMTEYANNYFKAQQSFLKNMYNFYDYFNSPIDEKDANAAITEYTLEIDDENKENYITFSEPSFQLITADSFNGYYNTDTGNTKELIYASDLVTKITPVTLEKINNFYIPQNKAGIIKIEPEKSFFSREKTYYRRTIRIPFAQLTSMVEDGQTELIQHKKTFFTYQNINFKFLSRDESYWYYVTEKPTQKLTIAEQETLKNDTEEVVQIDSIILQDASGKTYNVSGELFSQIVFFGDLINDYLLLLSQEKRMNYKVRKNMEYSQFMNFPSDTKIEKLMSAISPIFMGKILQPGNTSKYEKFTKEYEKRSNNESKMYDDYSKKEKEDLVNLYWENIPLTSLWYKGPKYFPSSFTYSINNGTYELDIQRVNKNGQTISEYLDYLINLKEGKAVPLVESPLANNEYQEVALVTPRNEYNYYRNVLDSANNWWAALAIPTGLVIGGWAMLAGMWEWWGTSNAATSGRNNRAWDKSDIDWGQLYDYKEGYWDWTDENVEINNNDVKETKQIRPVYFIHPQSYELYEKYRKTKDIFFGNFSAPDIKLTEDSTKAKFSYKNKYFTIQDSGEFNNEDKKYYHSYYSQVAYTPHLAKQDSNIFYSTSKFVMQQLDTQISIEDKYYILPLVNPNGKRFFRNGFDLESCASVWKEIFRDERIEFDRIQYHPLASCAQSISFSSLPYKEDSYSLREALEVLGYSDFKTLTQNTKNYKTAFINANISIDGILKSVFFVVFKEKNYEYSAPWVNVTNLSRNGYYTGDIFYKNIENEEEVDFSLIEGLTTGFYSSWNIDSNAKQATAYAENETYYQDEELTHRAYTIPQLINAKKYYFINSKKIVVTTLSSNEQTFKQKLYLHTNKENSIRDSHLTDSFCDINWHSNFNNIKNKSNKDLWSQLEYIYQGVRYSTKYWITKNIKGQLNGLTKGEFWLNYHKNTMFPTIQQEAKVIETQLTDYWYSAYLNSKFCEYFLPESWKTEINTSPNYFSNSIISTYQKENDNTVYAHLLNIYIPKVQIYKEQGKTLLPYYTIRKKKKSLDKIDSGYLTDFNNEFSLDSLSKNTAIKNTYQEVLKEQLDSWVYIENSAKTSYYYSTSGGTRWNAFLNNMGLNLNNYSLLEGMYVTMFKVLRDSFTTNNFDEYNRLKLKQQSIWNQLYADFPGILLENTYSNEDATTSDELYRLSYLYFKDISQPERGYNINMINQAEIQGFEGQELQIGDSIKINVSEYYDECDDIQQTLSQLLFITDISYSLRSDADLQLTVNNIKYQDKLIRRLAKLIK